MTKRVKRKTRSTLRSISFLSENKNCILPTLYIPIQGGRIPMKLYHCSLALCLRWTSPLLLMQFQNPLPQSSYALNLILRSADQNAWVRSKYKNTNGNTISLKILALTCTKAKARDFNIFGISWRRYLKKIRQF